MASVALSRRVEKVVGHPPLSERATFSAESFTRRCSRPAASRICLEVAAGDPEGRTEPAEAAHRMSRYCTRGLFPGSRFSSVAGVL
jgi:hypothetical protein